MEFPLILRLMIPRICKKLERASFDQGMGRHTKAEVYEMGLKDLRALSTLLGSVFTILFIYLFFPLSLSTESISSLEITNKNRD